MPGGESRAGAALVEQRLPAPAPRRAPSTVHRRREGSGRRARRVDGRCAEDRRRREATGQRREPPLDPESHSRRPDAEPGSTAAVACVPSASED